MHKFYGLKHTFSSKIIWLETNDVENGKIMDIQFKTEEFAQSLIKTFRVWGFEIGAGGKPETHNFFSLA